MPTHTRLQPNTRRIAFILMVLCVVLIACGSDNETAVGPETATLPAPTAIPTTPPPLLPPADDSLPALAPLPATVAEPAAPSAQPTPNPTVGEAATAAPVVATSPEPTATPPPAEPQVDESPIAAVVVASAERWSDCVVDAAARNDAGAVLDAIAAATTTDLSSVQLNALAADSINCDVVTANLAATDLGDHVDTAHSCLNAWLASSGGGSVFVGLTSIGWQQATPAWAQAHLVDALDSCFTGASFAADVLAVVAGNPSLVGAFDATCLATSFDNSGSLRGLAQSLANDPASATLYVSLSDAWVLNCANVGQMVAAAAAADGVNLSAATISCIDTELATTGAVAALVAGTADTDAVGLATIACLTDAEASALLG